MQTFTKCGNRALILFLTKTFYKGMLQKRKTNVMLEKRTGYAKSNYHITWMIKATLNSMWLHEALSAGLRK